jgi:peroxiredoxin
MQQLVELQEFKSKFSELGIDIYTVVVKLQTAVAMKEKTGVDFGILYDENLATARKMGLIHKNAIPFRSRKMVKRMGLVHKRANAEGIDLPQPATFLFDANGKILWSYVLTNYRIRPDTMDLFAAAEKHFGGRY